MKTWTRSLALILAVSVSTSANANVVKKSTREYSFSKLNSGDRLTIRLEKNQKLAVRLDQTRSETSTQPVAGDDPSEPISHSYKVYTLKVLSGSGEFFRKFRGKNLEAWMEDGHPESAFKMSVADAEPLHTALSIFCDVYCYTSFSRSTADYLKVESMSLLKN